jgi:hypothetical protein
MMNKKDMIEWAIREQLLYLQDVIVKSK